MIQLLFTAIFLEAVTIMLILFETPLRKLLIMGLDRVKRGWGPVMVKTLGGMVLAMLLATFYSILKIQNRRSRTVLSITPIRLHHDIKELLIQRKNTEAMKKESQELEKEAQEFKAKKAEEIKALEKEKARLGAELEGLEFELLANIKNINVAKANAVALRKQSEGFLLEYDCVLQEKQELRIQLQSLNYQKLSRSASKKNM